MEQELGRKLGVYAIDWVIFAFYAFFIGSLIDVFFLENFLSSRDTTTRWQYLFFVFLIYLIVVITTRQLRPRFHLYENGLIVLDKGQKSIWTWDELTHFEGTRHIRSVNTIPLWKSGANQFFAGKKAAFRVGALTGSANILVIYILSHMVVRQIPGLEARIRKGEEIQFTNLIVSLKGIGNQKSFYTWERIKSLHFNDEIMAGEDFRVLVSLTDERFSQELGRVFGIDGYLLMGLVDALRGTKFLPSMQADMPVLWRRGWRFMRTTGWKLVLTLIARDW